MDDHAAIDDLLLENRTFRPSEDFTRQTLVAGTFLYDEAARDDEAFWAAQAADLLTWRREWHTILEWDLPFAKWFVGGSLNVSENCLDRHVAAGLGDRVAIHWEGEPGDTRAVTYAGLLDEVQRFANVLKSLGVRSGDRVNTYLPMIQVVRRRRLCVRREWTSLLIVVSQALAVVPALAGFGALRVLRGARPLRAFIAVVRVLAIGGAAARDGRRVVRRHAASFALCVAGMTWLSSAVAFTLAEDVGENGRVHSFLDALWWSTATITTVGYGDIAPVTAAGRLVGVVTMVVGISTFAVVTAKIASSLSRSEDSPTAAQ